MILFLLYSEEVSETNKPVLLYPDAFPHLEVSYTFILTKHAWHAFGIFPKTEENSFRNQSQKISENELNF